MSEVKKLGIFVAGGTGGHINSAISLGHRWQKEGGKSFYISGKRPLDIKLFYSEKLKSRVYEIGARPLKGIKFPELLISIFQNFFTFLNLFIFLYKKKPSFLMGTGGYVCGPTLLAGKLLGVKVFVLEQNSVVGLTNKLLFKIADKIFVHFSQTLNDLPLYKNKIVVSGNPVRHIFYQENFFNASNESFETKTLNSTINILVFGGSLGAASINEFVWQLLDLNWSFPLNIVHQTGEMKDFSNQSIKIEKLKNSKSYQIKKYLENIEEYYKWADVIISRSGASTVSELRFVRKPCILIPYPNHKDQHQLINAQWFKEEMNFPVQISNCDQLIKDNAQEFWNFIELVKNSKIKQNTSTKSNIENPDEIIIKTILLLT